MPIVEFHLVDGLATPAQEQRLLTRACRLYAEVLGAPLERVRAFISAHRAERFAVAGDLVAHNGLHAPYFEFIVLAGRPAEERQRLLAGFTDLLVDTLGVPRELVRGSCRQIAAEDWAIGGVPASRLRQDEIAARAAAQASEDVRR